MFFFFVQSKEWFMLNSLAHHNLSINELKCFLLQRYIAYWEYEQRSSEMWHHCNVTVILNFIIDACYTSEAVSFRTNPSNSNNPIRFAMGNFFPNPNNMCKSLNFQFSFPICVSRPAYVHHSFFAIFPPANRNTKTQLLYFPKHFFLSFVSFAINCNWIECSN